MILFSWLFCSFENFGDFFGELTGDFLGEFLSEYEASIDLITFGCELLFSAPSEGESIKTSSEVSILLDSFLLSTLSFSSFCWTCGEFAKGRKVNLGSRFPLFSALLIALFAFLFLFLCFSRSAKSRALGVIQISLSSVISISLKNFSLSTFRVRRRPELLEVPLFSLDFSLLFSAFRFSLFVLRTESSFGCVFFGFELLLEVER
ncbi:hypothetical protein TRFO_34967 [Tritrichomonas foetus]|uniref:Uncharacterized protein n=1 Tax=Tritrichomonas foetus TaxID=1144522 RepID=A0A1J4JHK7_9EUKA|nr:hypothetical protein TRFO_34967 [Tritrichomonas foetus]|eukprot:OHS98632.1 hypothetical protein TRFO_34967 [Tritrichomonas foetus]